MGCVSPYSMVAGGLILLGVGGLFGLLLVWSPGTPRPLVDDEGRSVPGGLSEKVWVQLDGVAQGMFIESHDVSNPVLLFVHGGPGMPEYFLRERYPSGLERAFTVCWWEQRGSGLSFGAGADPASMTVERLVLDAIETTNYLRRRFGKEKIYILGHSFGSFIAIQAVARAPELYEAYLGMGQVVNQKASEVLAYDYALAELERAGSSTLLRRLQRLAVRADAPLPPDWFAVRDRVMHQLGVGTMREMSSVVTGIFLPVWQTRAYTLGEKIDIWRGKLYSRDRLWSALLSTDLEAQVRALEVPVYFLHGVHDYTSSYTLARAYFDRLRAPRKGFYSFQDSAHSPLFEEPGHAMRILREDVCAGATALAD